MNAAVAIAPLVVVFLLLVFWRWPAKHTMPVAFVLTAVLGGLLYWKLSKQRMDAMRPAGGSATVEGLEVDVMARLAARVKRVTVSEGEQKVLAHPQRIVFEDTVPTINIRFHDVDGNILYEYRDTALIPE